MGPRQYLQSAGAHAPLSGGRDPRLERERRPVLRRRRRSAGIHLGCRCEQGARLGSQPVIGLSGYEFANYQHLRPYPADGTLVSNANDGRCYVVAGGAPEYISAADASKVPGWGSQPVIGLSGYEFANYQHLRPYPADGTLVSNVNDGRCYVVAGGAPEWISAANASKVPGWGTQPVTGLSGYEFANCQHRRPYPVDGTFLATTSGNVYRVAGRAPFAVSSWSVFGGTQPHATIDQWDIDTAGSPGIGIASTPVDGTVVQGLPSGAFWRFDAGYRRAAVSTAGAVQVDDAGLAAYPVRAVTDATGPTTYAKAAAGFKGHAISLRYQVTDNASPRTQSTRIVVRNAKGRTVKRFTLGSQTTAVWHQAKWKPQARGAYRYFIYAKDLSGNKQAKIGSAKVTVR